MIQNTENHDKAVEDLTRSASAIPEDVPPKKVSGLSIKSVSGNELQVKWTANKESDFSHYNIYMGSKSSFKVSLGDTPPTGTSTTNYYSSTGLQPSTKYYYKVAAVDSAGNIGSLSNSKYGKTKSITGSTQDKPPKQVTSLTVSSVSSTELGLKWTANKESDFSHYNIYIGSKSSFKVSPGDTPPTGTSTTNSYSSTGLKPSTTYYYKVAAVDKTGHIGSLSSTKSGKTKPGTGNGNDTTPPAQVTGLTVSVQSSTQLNLDWNANTESDFNHYNIYRGTSSGFTVNPGVTQPVGTSKANSYSNGGLNPSTTYYYKVAAVDNGGNIGPLSSERSATTAIPPDTTPPAQVMGLAVTVQSSTQLNLGWNANSESDFNHYNVYRGTSSGFTVNPGVTQPVGTPATESYSSTGLNPSTTYYYKVAAVDDTGNIGPLSTEKSGTTDNNANTDLYDDFEGGTYVLSDGQKSPNGKWLNKYNGFGQVGVKEESNGNNVFYEFPQASKQSGETHASLALSTQKVSNGIIEFDMRTDKQLRQNNPANTWEAAWMMWRYVDDFHHYYFVLKTNGIEFGKKDTSCHCEEQVFLKTGSSPKLQLGSWTHVKISSIGAHTSIWLNGVLVVDMDDPSYSKTADMSSGSIGLYNEDAAVSFDNISIDPQ